MPYDDPKDFRQGGLAVGAAVGRYEVLERAEVGEHVALYKCRDPVLDRLVMVKHVFRGAGERAGLLDRCRREARTMAQLGSEEPAVATVHELLDRDDGLFLVMEHVPGRSLDSLMAANLAPAEPKAVLHILWQLAAALHKAHVLGIIHRDIRPEHIMVTEGLRARITDFSLAGGAGDEAALPGSARYMAPELLTGGAVDGRADMYSLGFVAYEMLVGRRRFEELFADVIDGPTRRERRWMAWHGDELLAAPPVRDVVPSVPQALSDIVARMIAKHPDARYPSMETLARTVRGTFSARRALAAMAREGPQSAMRRVWGPGAGEPADSLDGGGAIVKSPAIILEHPVMRPDDDIPEFVAPPADLAPRRIGGKLVVVTLAILAVLGGGIYMGVRAAIGAAGRGKSADQAFTGAMDLYRQGSYEKASAALSQLRDAYPQEKAAYKAAVLAALSSGQVAMAKDDFAGAAESLAAAKQQLQAVQSKRSDLKDWLQAGQEEIDSFDKMLTASRSFAEIAAAARRDLRAGDFDAARDAVSNKLPPLALAPVRKEQLAALASVLRAAEFTTQFGSYLSAAKTLATGENAADADRELAKAAEMLNSPPLELAGAVNIQRLRGDLEAAKQAIVDEQLYQAKVVEADKARQAGDKAGELAALQAAAAIKPSADLLGQIAALSKEAAVRQVRDLKAGGRLEEAAAILQRINAAGGDPLIQTELTDVQRLIRQQALMKAGEDALRDGRIDEAIGSLSEADRLGAAGDTAERLSVDRQQAYLAKGDQLLEAGQYAEASAAYESARKVRPSDSAAVDERLAAVTRRQQAEQYLAKARADEAKGDLAETLRDLIKAKALHDTPQVSEQITRIRYRQALALGAQAMGRGDYKTGRAYYLMAKGYRDTEEVRLLLEDAEKKLKGSE